MRPCVIHTLKRALVRTDEPARRHTPRSWRDESVELRPRRRRRRVGLVRLDRDERSVSGNPSSHSGDRSHLGSLALLGGWCNTRCSAVNPAYGGRFPTADSTRALPQPRTRDLNIIERLVIHTSRWVLTSCPPCMPRGWVDHDSHLSTRNRILQPSVLGDLARTVRSGARCPGTENRRRWFGDRSRPHHDRGDRRCILDAALRWAQAVGRMVMCFGSQSLQ